MTTRVPFLWFFTRRVAGKPGKPKPPEIAVNPRSPYECYWSRRALAAEKRVAELEARLLSAQSA